YFELLRARRQLARVDETLDFLTSQEESELRGAPATRDPVTGKLKETSKSRGLLPLIRSFVQAGAKGGLPSDLSRVEAEVVRRHPLSPGQMAAFHPDADE